LTILIRRVKVILEPLAIAANITQATHTRLDHVLLTLGNLFRIYSNPELDTEVRTVILASLERRWAKADQDVFIVAVFLNPYIRGRCFSRAALTEATLYNTTKRVFERIFGQSADLDLLKAFTDYSRGQSEFSDEQMSLDMMAEMHKTEVGTKTCILTCVLTHLCT
jgi:hypothetical protein